MVECPYCDSEEEIDHDDGSYGYEENKTYEQECEHCGHVFVYTTVIEHVYYAEKAPRHKNNRPTTQRKNSKRAVYGDDVI